jgi:hypothetical protein
MLSGGVCLIHDNARAYFAHVTSMLLEKFKWGLLNNPQYNPDSELMGSNCFFT